MINIAVNIGTYSIKFLTYKIDKKKVSFLNSQEVVLDPDDYDISQDDYVTDLQIRIIQQFIAELDSEYRLILNAPNSILTERFVELPIKNKKKAALMIPFKLEENIPYSLTDCHMAYALESLGDSCKALVNISSQEDYSYFHHKMNEYKIVPKVVTSEISALYEYIKFTPEILPHSFCVLDFGHTTTKAYFFIGKELISTHISYIAGREISNIIGETYNISQDESTIYKHQNCFVLTEDQYENVNDSQKSFAELMDNILTPLINDFNRWNIGFKVQNGISISEIFITGGSSNIKNIKSYFASKLNVQVSFFDTYKQTIDKKLDPDEKQRRKLFMSSLLSQTFLQKSKLVNFLNGQFSIQGSSELPLKSFVYTLTRVAVVSLILVLSLSIERFFTSRDLSAANKKLTSLAKSPILELTGRQKRLIAKQPDTVLRKLKKENKLISQEVKTIQSAVEVNALYSLQTIAKMIEGMNVEITEFSSTSASEFVAVFKSEDPSIINQLADIFENSAFDGVYVDKNLAKRTLTVNGTDAR